MKKLQWKRDKSDPDTIYAFATINKQIVNVGYITRYVKHASKRIAGKWMLDTTGEKLYKASADAEFTEAEGFFKSTKKAKKVFAKEMKKRKVTITVTKP